MGSMQDLTAGYAAGTPTGRLAARSPVSLSLSGGRELIRTFAELPLRMQKRVARTAVRKVARRMVKVVKATMSSESPPVIDTGLLKKSLGFRMWTSKTGQFAVGASIGPRTGFGTLVVRNKRGNKKALTKKAIAKVVAAGGSFARAQFADPVRYGHLVEGGATRAKHGTVAARPFMGHAYLRSRDVMAGVLRTEIRNGTEREARKLARVGKHGR